MDDVLPPGFRFYPTEEELILFYLHNKLEGKGPPMDHVIPVVHIYDHSPWLLPQLAGVQCRKDPEQWFFFIPIQEKTAHGGRPNRLTDEGFWKATGSPGYVYSSDNHVIGIKRTMVFYQGRAPNGRKTEWKMNEYIAIKGEASSSSHSAPKLRQELSLCRVYKKSKTIQRSFDRRPLGVGTHGPVVRQPRRVDEATATDHQNHPLQKTSSQYSPVSSGEHVINTSQTVESDSSNMDHMALGNESWWEWEKVSLE